MASVNAIVYYQLSLLYIVILYLLLTFWWFPLLLHEQSCFPNQAFQSRSLQQIYPYQWHNHGNPSNRHI
jgi:hypothetical protein